MAEIAGTLCSFNIVGRRRRREPLYLVLRRPDGSWDLPKGRVRPSEPIRRAAVRETEEETGITPFLTGSMESGADGEHKIWVFRAETPGRRNVVLSKEHTGYDWVTAKKAMSILYPPLAKIVEKMVDLSESTLSRTPLLEGEEDPHAHLKADSSLKPPSGPSDRYYSWPKLVTAHRSNYFRDKTAESKFASSRETPAKHLDVPLGSWRIDDGHKGLHGRDIDQLRAHNPRDIKPHPGEMTWEKGLRDRARHPDVERYANWLEKDHDEHEAGGGTSDVAKIPPLSVTQHATTGHLRISDGHRRLAAVDLVNQRRKAKGKAPLKIPGWTNPTADHPRGDKDSEGRVMKVGLTHEIASKGAAPVKEDRDLTELRDSCLDCVRKHLSQALILMQEVHQGYPQHRWIAIGHMGEAADEALKEHPKLADEIRKHRLKYMANGDYQVPIMDLIKKASKAAGDLSEGRKRAAHSCGSVAVSLLKPGTKRYEKWLSLRNYRRKATLRKKQQEDDMAFTVTNLRTGEVTTSEDQARKAADREAMLEDWRQRRELRESGKEILFWSDDHRPEDYQNCVLNVSEEKITRVVEALQAGTTLESYKGWADCRICGEHLGSADVGGHGFVWPQLAEHYIVEHGVWTPDLDKFHGHVLGDAIAEAKTEEAGLDEEREANKDGTTSCGVFIPLPYSIAKDFPDKRAHDDSVPHFTLLFMGDMSPKSYKVFVKLVRKFAEKLKPFECDTYAYGEFLNAQKQKIPHMRPSPRCATRMALLHSLLRRYIEKHQKEIGAPVKHSYGHLGMASSMVPYEIQFKPHATLDYTLPMMPYKGPKPTGCWRVTEIECWGHEKVRIPLGMTKADQPIGLTRDPLAIKYPMSVPDAVAEDKLPGGLADKATPNEFDPKQLAMGVKVEMEHTSDPKIAREIAMDHLKEDPNYYTKLKTIHNESASRGVGSLPALRGYERHPTPTGTGPSHGDIGLAGSLPYLELKKRLERKKLAGLK